METRIIDCKNGISEEALKESATIIQNGGLVAFPTETVYGLGADGLNGPAVAAIFKAKGRPNDNPLILHVAEKEEAFRLWRTKPPLAEKLMDTFWPGPLTIIAPKSAVIPDEVTAGLDTVAVRMPSDPVAHAFIAASKTPIAAPSANLSGKPSPTTAAHVLMDMDGRIPLILDGGACTFGVESTVITLAGETPVILRPGAITREMLAAVIGEVGVSKSVLSPLQRGEVAASPGMKYKHYAPKAEVIVVNGMPEKAAKKILALYNKAQHEGRLPAIAGTEQTKNCYAGAKCVILGDRSKPVTLCANLFRSLRELDESADIIFAEGVPAVDEGLAYMNRLLRSAGFHVIDADNEEENL